MLSPISSISPLRISIIRTSSIGDVVLASACLDLLANLKVPTSVRWIGRQPSLELIAAAYPDVETVDYSDDTSKTAESDLYKMLSDSNFIVDLQKSVRSHLLCRSIEKIYDVPVFTYRKASFSRTRAILESRIRGRKYLTPSSNTTVSTYQYDRMVSALRAGLAWQLPIELLDSINSYRAVPHLPIGPPEHPPSWLRELSLGKWIAIAPGASYETKQAPVELIRSICESFGKVLVNLGKEVGLVFVGDDKDRHCANAILDKISWPHPTLNLAGKITLVETARVLQKVSGLVSNDSSLAHIAEAVNTPAFVLFGPTIEAFGFAPRMNTSRAFSSSLGCRPCSKHGKTTCRFADKKCFTDIPPGDVVFHLERVALHA